MSDTQQKTSSFVFTGWHMAGVMALFFGTVITVNMIMAWNAVTSWSGLVVPNTYVASQQFNTKVAAQRAMAASGIRGRLTVREDGVRYEISHPERGAVDVGEVLVNFRRPVSAGQDFSLELTRFAPGVYTAAHDIGTGQWVAEVKAADGERTVLHEANRVMVVGGRK